MSLNNEISVSQLITEYTSVFFGVNSWILKYSYQGVREFNQSAANPMMKYKPGETVTIEIAGYPDLQKGLQVTPQGVQTKLVPYTIDETKDLYNVPYAIDSVSQLFDVKGGNDAFFVVNKAMMKDGGPNMEDPAMKNAMNRYADMGFQVLNGGIEVQAATSFKESTFYCPITRPANLPSSLTIQEMNKADVFMNDLGFYGKRIAPLSVRSYGQVVDTLNNQFDNRFSFEALTEGNYPELQKLKGFNILSSNAIDQVDASPQWVANNTSSGVTVQAVATDGSTITFTGVIATNGLVFNSGTLIAIPSVRLLKRPYKTPALSTLVVKVRNDTNGNGDGTVTVTLSEPLQFAGFHSFVDGFPEQGAVAEVFPAYMPNYIFLPKGLMSNPLPIGEVYGARNAQYISADRKMILQSYAQGNVANLQNLFRLSMLCPILAIPDATVVIPTAVPTA